MRSSSRIIARARRVRMLVMDVDGVLTDGRMFLSEHGEELKAFHTRDGIALNLACRAGLKLAFITGETSMIAKARGTKLGVHTIVLGARRKGESVEALMSEHGLTAGAVAYIGDDLLDIPAMQRVGFAIAVADAAPAVKAVADLVTKMRGGTGAVRECVELILGVQGRWKATLEAYLKEHGGLAPARTRGRRSV